MGRYIISPMADFVGFALPLAFSFAIMARSCHVDKVSVPLLWWIPLGICIDVAHVYGTLFRTVLDSHATRQNWALYLVAGPGLLLVALLVNVCLGTQVGWTLLAYYAMFHFAKQPYGVLCLYKVRMGERDADDHIWDYWTCMCGAFIPFLLMHAQEDSKAKLRWFNEQEDFLFRLAPTLQIPLYIVNVVVPLVWLARLLLRRQRQGTPLNKGKLWIMATQYVIWTFGTSDHLLTSLAFHNVCHGITSMVLVWHVVRHRLAAWRLEHPSTMKWVDKANEAALATPWRYIFVMVALATAEEFCWDVFVNQEMLPDKGFHLPDFTERQKAVATSVLMWPQLSHYFLDCFIWKLALKNPGLREALWSEEASLVAAADKKSS